MLQNFCQNLHENARIRTEMGRTSLSTATDDWKPKKIFGEILWKYFETNCRYCQRFLMQTKIMKSTQNVIQESTKRYNLIGIKIEVPNESELSTSTRWPRFVHYIMFKYQCLKWYYPSTLSTFNFIFSIEVKRNCKCKSFEWQLPF